MSITLCVALPLAAVPVFLGVFPSASGRGRASQWPLSAPTPLRCTCRLAATRCCCSRTSLAPAGCTAWR